jgi:hypothetical protein
LLGASVLLSATALWWPDDTLRHVAALRTDDRLADFPTATPSVAPAGPATGRLASQLPETLLEPAVADPFVGAQPPPPPPPKPVPVVIAPPPPPQAPAITYRYLGRMTDPSGTVLVYLAKADAAVVASVGTRLDEGYVVQSVDTDGIRLHYPPLDAHVVIPVPPPPDAANR